MNQKPKLLIFLFSAVVLLIILNVIAEIFVKSQDPPPPKEFSVDTLNVIFWDVLKTYGIASEWVSVKRINPKDYDSVKQILKVEIPTSVSPINIVKELHSRLPDQYAEVIAREKEINGNSDVNIYSNKSLKLKAELRLNKKLSIHQPIIAFLLDNVDNLSGDEFESLLLNPYQFGILLKPSIENRNRADSAVKNLKEFYVYIDDEIEFDAYSLDTDMDKNELKRGIKNLSSHFSQAKRFFYDDNSEMFKSALFNFIRDEFEIASIKIHPMNKFDRLEVKDDKDLNSIFEFYLRNLNADDKKIFIMNASLFHELNRRLSMLRKKGYNILYPSTLFTE